MPNDSLSGNACRCCGVTIPAKSDPAFGFKRPVRRRPSVYLQARLAEIYGLTREQIRASVAETLRRHKEGEKQLHS